MVGFVDGEMKKKKYARCWYMALHSKLSEHHLLQKLLSLECISPCFIINHPELSD